MRLNLVGKEQEKEVTSRLYKASAIDDVIEMLKKTPDNWI